MTSVVRDITVEINGDRRTLPEVASVAELLARLGIQPGRVAVEVNGRIVRRPEWDTSRVADGDRIEIVQFVGGG